MDARRPRSTGSRFLSAIVRWGRIRAFLAAVFLSLGATAQAAEIVLSGPATAAGPFTLTWVSNPSGTYYNPGDFSVKETQNAPYGSSGATNLVSYDAGGALSYTVPARPAGTYYYIVIYPATGCIPFPIGQCVPVEVGSNALTVVHLPAAAAPDAPATSNTGSYLVSWSAAATATSYQLEQSLNGGAWSRVVDANALVYSTSGLGNGTYSYRLRGCNASGCGAYSASVVTVVTLPPSTPTLSAPSTDGTGAFPVTAGAVATATGYQFERSIDGGAWSTVQDGAANIFSASGLGNATYSFRARACNAGGCSANSDPVSTIVLLPPATPTLTLPAASATGTFGMSWTASATATTYQVDQSANFGPYTRIFSGPVLGTNLFGMGTGFYRYVVRACNNSGCSADSAAQGISVLLPPAAPAAPTVPAANTTGSFSVSWAAQADATHYQLDRRLNGGSWATLYDGGNVSFPVSGLISGVYDFRLRACNGSGCSADSAISSSGVNLSPSGLSAPAINGSGSYTVTWAAVAGATSYVLQERFDNGAWSTLFSGDATAHGVSGRAPGAYQYQVQACTGTCGAFTAPVTTLVSVPAIPGSLADSGSGSDHTISWSPVSLADRYELQDRRNGGAFATVYSGPATAQTLNSLVGYFEFRVRACNGVGCSDYSPLLFVDILGDEPVPDSQLPAGVPGVNFAEVNASDQIGATEGNFRVDESGAATYKVPLFAVAGSAGVTPRFALKYSSQDGNGLLGQGWSIDGLSSISRCRQTLLQDGAAKPITWTSADRFCLDGQRLVFVPAENPGKNYGDPNTVYHTEIESYAVVTAVNGSAGNPEYFSVARKDGSLTYYGGSPDGAAADAKQVNPANGQALIWAQKKFQDSVGNPIWYVYTNDAAGQRISEVRYAYGAAAGPSGYNARLIFNYDLNRLDSEFNYLAGMQVALGARLISVVSENGGAAVRSYNLTYQSGQTYSVGGNSIPVNLSRLVALQECAGGYCLPATQFTWTDTASQIDFGSGIATSLGAGARGRMAGDIQPADVNGDGCIDLVWLEVDTNTGAGALRYAVSDCQGHFIPALFANGAAEYAIAVGNNSVQHKVADYNADGRMDVLFTMNGGNWQVFLSTPQLDGSWKLSTTAPLDTGVARSSFFSDMNADGLADSVLDVQATVTIRPAIHDSSQGLASPHYYRYGTGQTLSMSPLASIVSFADLNGDGINDLLRRKNDCFGGVPPGVPAVCVSTFYLNLVGDNDTTPFAAPEVTPITLTDLNSDGLADLFYAKTQNGSTQWFFKFNTGLGMGPETAVGFGADIQYNGTNEPASIDFVDYNLDGHPDLIFYDKQASMVKVLLWNTVTKAFDAPRSLFPFSPFNQINKERHWFMDANGDGAPDFMTVNTTSADNITVRLANGANQPRHTITRITNGLGAQTRIGYGSLITSGHYDRLRVGTLTGVNTVTISPQQFFINAPGININYPFPTITYQQSYSKLDSDTFYTTLNGIGDLPPGTQTLPKNPDVPILEWMAPVYIVTNIQGSAPAAADTAATLGAVDDNAFSSISYYYAEARIQAGGRGLLGFHRITTVDEQTQPKVMTATYYRQDYPFVGSPLSTQVYYLDSNDDPVLIRRADSNWGFQNYDPMNTAYQSPPYRPVLLNAVEQTFEPVQAGHALLSYVHTINTFDPYGNALNVQVDTYDGAQNLIASKITASQYGISEAERRLGRLSQTVVTSKRFPADPQVPDVVRTSSFSYYCLNGAPCDPQQKLRGLLYEEVIEPDRPPYTLTTRHDYDAFGNPARNTVRGADIADRYTRWEYDAQGRFKNRTFNSLEQKLEDVISRNNLGQPLVVNGLNGIVRQFGYGPFGRQYLEYANTGAYSVSLRYASLGGCPAGTALAETVVKAGGGSGSTCYDKLVRPTRAIATGFDGSAIYTDTDYDSHGRVKHTGIPYFAGAYTPTQVPATALSYDFLGRVTGTTYPDGATSAVDYQGLQTTYTNARGFTKVEVKNALGEMDHVADHLGAQVQYAYYADGALRKTTNTVAQSAGAYGAVAAATGVPSSIVTTFTYDAAGRKSGMNDPDKGNWSYTYYATGELKTQTDAKGQVIAFEYDTLGRVAHRTDTCSMASDTCTDGTLQSDVYWLYDSADNGVGQLDYSIDAVSGYIRMMAYDSLGRVSQSVVSLGVDENYFQRINYDSYGRVREQYDAAGPFSGVRYVYNGHGYQAQVLDAGDGQPYYTVQSMDAAGRVTGELNGAVTTVRSYDVLGRLSAINSTVAGLNNVQNLQYHYDAGGNLDWRKDNNRALTETFVYDELDRLVRDQAGTLVTVVYDSFGNIRSKGGVTYSYGAGAGPHAVTGYGTVLAYTYDANGNNRSGDGRAIAYSVFDKPLSISKGNFTSRFAYDPERAFYKRTDTKAGQTTTTVTVGSVETVTQANGDIEVRRYVAGALIKTRYNSGGIRQSATIQYLLKDHLGSLDVIIDQNGSVVGPSGNTVKQSQSYDPWGLRRSPTTWVPLSLASLYLYDHSATNRGFTGHEMVDEAGLIHMRGRLYDPRLGRFLQADPTVQFPTDTQSYNRYSYVLNNPLIYTDPSGYGVLENIIDALITAVLFVAGTAACYGNYLCGAAFAGAWRAGSVWAQGGTWNQMLRQGAITGASSWAFAYLNGLNLSGADTFISYGTVGGITNILQGGDFGSGFLAAGITPLVGAKIAPGTALGNALGMGGRIALNTIIGGTVSELTGGKFANGAGYAAFIVVVGESTSRENHSAQTRPDIEIGEVYGHGVWGIGKHGSVRFYPDDPGAINAYLKENGFSQVLQVDKSGRPYIVFSGGPSFEGSGLLGSLRGDINRVSDLAEEPNSFVGKVYAPADISKDAFIKRLINNTKAYNNNQVNYDLLPSISSGYNSNSYFIGLIESTGGRVEGSINWQYEGFKKPVPKDHF